MRFYYDTGIVLKLYLNEKNSDRVRQHIVRRGEPLFLNSLHFSEMMSAIQLMVFRKDSSVSQIRKVLAHIEEDRRNLILNEMDVDWNRVWSRCCELARQYSSRTGCRTLDTLHVASALAAESDVFVSSDQRQIRMARNAGLETLNPL